MRKVTDAEPMPVLNGNIPVQDLVIADIEARKAQGLAKYGTLLQPMNGRNSLVDAYQESLDQCQYLRQKLEEESILARALEDLLEEAVNVGTNGQAVIQAKEVLHAYRRGNPR